MAEPRGDDNVDRRFWAGVLAAIDAATGTCGAVAGLTLPAPCTASPPSSGTALRAWQDRVRQAFAGQRVELLFTNLSIEQENTLRAAFAGQPE